MNKKRNLERLRFFYICILLFNVIFHLMYHLNRYGFNINIFREFTMESTILLNSNILLSIIAVIIFHKENLIDEEVKTYVNNSIKPLYFINIFFITYILICFFLLKDTNVTISAIMMKMLYIAILMLTKKIRSINLNNRQLQWQKDCGYIDEDYIESNLLWRFKIWCSPHVNVPFKNRWTTSSRLLFDVFLVYCIIACYGDLMSLILSIFVLRDTLFLIEGLLGLQTSITGICTGITEQYNKHNTHKYYKIYVTDYENKRELTFLANEPVFINENSYMTVVHGMFSKRVLYVEGLFLDIR
ncbi:hypothetical protein [uncultured Clostridium sp.]|nr:hypothetical protein [uncultured Clostridium sp.]